MEETLEKFSQLSNDELIVVLGKEIQSQRMGLNEKESPSETGNKALKKYFELLRADICENEQLKKFMVTDKVFDEIQIAAGICDAIIGYFSGVTLLSLSILIARRGLINYCNRDDNG